MLIQFNFENYKTYLNLTSLDLTATNLTELPSNTFQYRKGETYLKTAAIYGANASGKSNILEALRFMRQWVLNSFELSKKRKGIPVKQFRFCKKGKYGTSTFEVFFSFKKEEYQYGFEVDETMIHQEWLYKRNFNFKEKFDLVFEREKQHFNLREDLSSTKDLLNSINEKTLLVSILSSLNIQDAIHVSSWFEETSVVNFGDVTFEFLISRALPHVNFEDPNEYKRFVNYLQDIDVGIEGIRLERTSKGTSLSVEEMNEASEEELTHYKIYTKHRNMDTHELDEVPLNEESSGTQKMISLYYYLYDKLNNGGTLFVDEMDAKLHPLLTRYIINLFQDEETNPHNAQLIFTTHDTTALSNELFRRDQIWFVEKSSTGVSSLYSLAEYKVNDTKVRKDATFNKNYLGGRYGAIPNLAKSKAGD